jgi:hypothetical protein
MVTLKGRTFNIKSTLNGGASLSDVAVKERWGRWLAIFFWGSICLKIKIPEKKYEQIIGHENHAQNPRQIPFQIKNHSKSQIKTHGAWTCLPAIALVIITHFT